MTWGFEIRIVSGARKHGISRRRIEQALLAHTQASAVASNMPDPKIRYVGTDERGEEIEVWLLSCPACSS
jgi:hypothetical protein